LDPDEATRVEFLGAVRSALELIEHNDEIRFRRVLREIRIVVHMPCLTFADYSRSSRLCALDLRFFRLTADKEIAIMWLACLLVHEATHGHLHRRKLMQSGRNFNRVEMLCTLEEVRFARRIGIDMSDRLSAATEVKAPTFLERLRFTKNEIKIL
jgi:hypothetical protein